MPKVARPLTPDPKTARATTRGIRGSPRKLNLVAAAIRGLPAQRAVDDLLFMPQRAAEATRKTLESAIANAENNHNLDVDALVVDEAWVGKGLVMKRIRPRARGRAMRIQRPFSRLTVVVRERDEEETAPKQGKAD